MAMAMMHYGCTVSAICPAGHPLRFLTGLTKIYSYSGLDSLGSLRRAIQHSKPDRILPCDDMVVLQLYSIHASHPELRPLIEASLGNPEFWPILGSRDLLLQAAAEAGIRTPRNQAVKSVQQLESWPEEKLVLKRNGTLGGYGVAVAHDRKDALSIYKWLMRPTGIASAWKRYIVNREPLSFWQWRHSEAPVVTAQQFIPGRPANTMIVCDHGEVLASITVEVLRSAGTTGAATTVRLLQNEEIEEASRKLARKLKLTGFHGLDFMLATGEEGHPRNAAYLIELNPRCTQIGHLRLHGAGDLAGVISKLLHDSLGIPYPVPEQQNEIAKDTVAFFPTAVLVNPANPWIQNGYHDVPWEQREMVRDLLQEVWPYRQWTGRLYHHFFPAEPAREICYEEK